jgi:aspartate carbamoyltransferase catalytic subunit
MSPAAHAIRRTLLAPPALASPFPYHPGSLLSVLDLTVEGVSRLLARATELETEDPLLRDHILAKRRIALLFYESSTRTRTSFELAAKALGADTTLVSSLSSSIEKGESLKDTGLTLRALGAQAIILRHNSSGAPWLLEEATRLPVINAGDGMHEHPTQALLDLRTILAHIDPETKSVILSGARAASAESKACPERGRRGDRVERGPASPDLSGACPSSGGPALKSVILSGARAASEVEGPAVPSFGEIASDTLSGVTVTIVGDILHSRVARSNMLLLPRLGARVLLCGPKELLPEQAANSGPGIAIERDFDAALRQSQVVMMLRIQAERLAGLQLDLDEYKAAYQLTGQRLAAHAPAAVVLHPGPIIRGLEITAGVADGPQSAILEQVHNGVAIRMAVVERALVAQV